ncbi:MAG: hypothetical protein HUK00_09490 [Bacteroidaceae bacterium]|nr:hypothetical protein [Bacteroidaceae bacterium]
MILLIFEGNNEEPKIMATIKALFFPSEEQVHCSYGHDTASLYAEIKKHQESEFEEPDVFEIVKEALHRRNEHSLDKYKSHQFDSIYLFFDYDPQNDLGIEVVNERIEKVIELFSEPTDKGKMFVSYPMIEALYCEDSLPDKTFVDATVSLADCHDFKQWCRRYIIACNKELILYRTYRDKDGKYLIVDKDNTPERKEQLTATWISLVKENVMKANFICNDVKSSDVAVDAIGQGSIFSNELAKLIIPKKEVGILSAFALFLYDYFHGNGDF